MVEHIRKLVEERRKELHMREEVRTSYLLMIIK